MQKPTSIGTNRTGIATSPIDSVRTAGGAEAAVPLGEVDHEILAGERLTFAREAPPVGTMPPPMSLEGVAKTGIALLEGHRVTVFLDKLGERAAFERAGTRLYEALLVKHAAADVHEGGPTREQLEQIRDDELRHFGIVRDAIRELGGDPTVMTPCADVAGVMGMGLVQVLTDPRTTLTQCLDAILVAELADNDAWLLLVDLADGLGHDELANRFRIALQEEEQHLAQVRAWIANALRGQAGVAPTPPQPERSASR
jgi:rubrerythrin